MKKKNAIKIAAATAMAASSFVAVAPVSHAASHPAIKSSKVLNPKTLQITFSNGKKITLPLSRPLKDGKDKVTFWKYGYHYSLSVNYHYPEISRITVIDAMHFTVKFNDGTVKTITMKKPEYALHKGENIIQFTENYKTYKNVAIYYGQTPTNVTALDATHIKVTFDGKDANTTIRNVPRLKEGLNKGVHFVYYYQDWYVNVNYSSDREAPVLENATLTVGGKDYTANAANDYTISFAKANNQDMITALKVTTNEKATGTIDMLGNTLTVSPAEGNAVTIDLVGLDLVNHNGVSVQTIKKYLDLAGGTVKLPVTLADAAGNKGKVTITITE